MIVGVLARSNIRKKKFIGRFIGHTTELNDYR